jgi:lipid-binding SYLF domain-containing protein
MLALAASISSGSDTRSEAIERISDAAIVLREVMSAPDKAIPREILEKAQCIGIIPGVKKAGFIVGAGKGIFVCGTEYNTWSAPSTVTVEGGSVGFQFGASETDVVLVVQNEKGEQKLMQGRFTIEASGGAAAGPVGRTAQAATDAELRAEILSYSRSRGLFAGVDVGATFRPDNDVNHALYGLPVSQRDILTGQVAHPFGTKNLYEELSRYTPTVSNTIQ